VFKKNYLILLLLLIGVIFRLVISANGNFIFNMDNARDMVDVREMVVLGHQRLIGQTTAIDGVFYGPAWYYILAVPFIISGGNPYASIIMEILLWAMGGYFLLSLTKKYYGNLSVVAVGFIWISSNFILLASQYAFNPNPILFLTPLFIYLLLKYFDTSKWQFNAGSWFLAGLFLHFEVAVGIFMPVIIVLFLAITKRQVFKDRLFYLGPLVFLATLLPQILFDIRHNFFLAKSLLDYKSGSHGAVKINLLERAISILKSFYDTLLPTFLNADIFTKLMIPLSGLLLFGVTKKGHLAKDKLTLLLLIMLSVTLLGLIPLKVDLMRWHLNAVLVAAILLVGFIVSNLNKISLAGKVLSYVLVGWIIIFCSQNIAAYVSASQKEGHGESILKNELSAVDYTYAHANGKNFKVYVYLPSVIDYPYQYLYWWRGLKNYGYLPEDYAYLPNKPEYIKQKEKFNNGSNPESSGLVFLIKQSDQSGIRHLWENSFKNLELISTDQVGSLIIETRKEK
jgi:hypothetical protein